MTITPDETPRLANAAERQYERVAELGSHRDVFAELVRRPRERVGG